MLPVMFEELRKLSWLRMVCRVRFNSGGRIGLYWGYALRGGFGYAFRRVTCGARRPVCRDCPFEQGCPYIYIYETRPPKGSAIMSKYNAAPRPFIFRNPDHPVSEVQAGEEVSFGLTLVGEATRWLPQFVLALQVLGDTGLGKDRVRFTLDRVECLPRGEVLFKEAQNSVSVPVEQERLVSTTPVQEWNDLTLRFISPLRIKFQGHLACELPFHVLVRNLLRRTSLLAYFHCRQELNLDFKRIIAAAQEVATSEAELVWQEWGRRSTRSGQQMKLGGLVGKVTYRGPLTQFQPLVAAGEVLHLGKAVSFGFGKYRMGED